MELGIVGEILVGVAGFDGFAEASLSGRSDRISTKRRAVGGRVGEPRGLAVPGAQDAFVVATVDPPRDLVLTVPDGHGGHAVVWEHVLEPLDGGRTRLIVRGRASSQAAENSAPEPCFSPTGTDGISATL